jgi:glutamyl-tRNA synthetase
VCRAHAAAAGIGFGKLAQPLRVALTGSTVSPGVFEVMRVLGRAEVLARIEDAATGRNPVAAASVETTPARP